MRAIAAVVLCIGTLVGACRGGEKPKDVGVWAGGDTTCVRRMDGQTYCFGSHGIACGLGDEAEAEVCLDPWAPRFLPLDPKAQKVVVSDGVCTSGVSGNPECWLALPPDPLGFRPISAMSDVSDWTLAGGTLCGVRPSEEVECLALNDPGATPRRVRFASRVHDLVAAGEFVCGVRDQETLCWETRELEAVPVKALAGVTKLESAGVAICGKNKSDELRCCEVPDADAECPAISPPQGLPAVHAYVSYGYETCLLLEDQSLHCTPYAQGDGVGSRPPRAVAIAAGRRHICAITPSHETMCWGRGDPALVGRALSAFGQDSPPKSDVPAAPDPPRRNLVAAQGETCHRHLPCAAGYECKQHRCVVRLPCQLTGACQVEGRCSLTSLGCAAKSDLDCIDSNVCAEEHRCHAQHGRCTQPPSASSTESSPQSAPSEPLQDPRQWRPPQSPWKYVTRHRTNAPFGVECGGPGVCLDRFDGAYFVLNRRWNEGYVIDLMGNEILSPKPQTMDELHRRAQAAVVEVLHRKRVARAYISCPVANTIPWLVGWSPNPVVDVLPSSVPLLPPLPKLPLEVNDLLGHRAVFSPAELETMTSNTFEEPNLRLHWWWLSEQEHTDYHAFTVLWSRESRRVYLKRYHLTVPSDTALQTDGPSSEELLDVWWQRIEAETMGTLQALGVREVRLHEDVRCKLRELSKAPPVVTVTAARVRELHRLWR